MQACKKRMQERLCSNGSITHTTCGVKCLQPSEATQRMAFLRTETSKKAHARQQEQLPKQARPKCERSWILFVVDLSKVQKVKPTYRQRRHSFTQELRMHSEP